MNNIPLKTSQTKMSHRGSTKSSVKKEKDSRPVSKLRPKKPVTMNDSNTIVEVAKAMTAKRMDNALLIGKTGSLSGILTDNDITRRVVAKLVDEASTEVSEVMTPNPKCVRMTDSGMYALGMMVENHFRHLPVVDGNGHVVGVLDIAKCLFDVISRVEKMAAKKGK